MPPCPLQPRSAHLELPKIPLKDAPALLESLPFDLTTPRRSARAFGRQGASGGPEKSFPGRDEGEEPKPEVSLLLKVKCVDL